MLMSRAPAESHSSDQRDASEAPVGTKEAGTFTHCVHCLGCRNSVSQPAGLTQPFWRPDVLDQGAGRATIHLTVLGENRSFLL